MMLKLKCRIVFFVTNNFNKFNEARRVLGEYRIAVGMLRVKTAEIQGDKIEEIAQASVIEASKNCNLPIIVEDAGLFIEALRGFPGPYAAYVYKTIGNAGLVRLMENAENRNAKFQSAIAFCNGYTAPVCFEGEASGKITKEERKEKGKSVFGFDPIFQPLGSVKTFAEMTIGEKNDFSHRAKAFRKFAEWYKSCGEQRFP